MWYCEENKKPVLCQVVNPYDEEGRISQAIALHGWSAWRDLDPIPRNHYLRYQKAGQPSGRNLLPSFHVRSKNKKNIKITNYKQWLSIWEKAKNKCIPKKYTFKYQIPTFKGSKRDLINLI